MKRLTALALFLLVLLPTHLPWWLDTARPAGGQPSPAAHRDPGHGRPRTTRWPRRSAGPLPRPRPAASSRRRGPSTTSPASRWAGPSASPSGRDGLLRAFTYGIDELRTLRVVRAGRRAPGRASSPAATRPQVATVGGHDRVEPLRRRRGGRRGRPARPRPRRRLRLGRGLQHRDPARATRSGWRSRSCSLDGALRRYGRILAAEFVRGDARPAGRPLRGRRGAGYYDPEGTPAAQGLPALAPQLHAHHLALHAARACTRSCTSAAPTSASTTRRPSARRCIAAADGVVTPPAGRAATARR